MDQHNEFRENIESGEVVLGSRASSFTQPMVEIYGDMGFDFAWLDYEHAGGSPWDSNGFEHLTAVAEAADIELLVRLPAGDPSLVRKVLDAGVRNLLIPRVETAEEVRTAVATTRFVYDGSPGARGLGGARASSFGNVDSYSGYIQEEDGNVCLGVMIETASAVDNLTEILSVPELGFVFVGPGDLSVQLGHPGELQHPDVQDAIEEIVTTTCNMGVPLAGIAPDARTAHEKIEAGYQVVRLGSDFGSVRAVLGEEIERLAELRGE